MRKINHKAYCLVLIIFWVMGSQLASAGTSNKIESLRSWTAPDHTRLVFGLTSAVEHKLFTLSNPSRLVLDIDNVTFKAVLPKFPVSDKVVSLIRQAPRGKKSLRVVVDLKGDVSAKSFLLKPNANYGHRLVLDLYPNKKRGEVKTVAVKKAAQQASKKKWVIAIDAGHGGEDPGAKGRRGTREKDVVLAIAKKLAVKINQQPNMKAYLVRSGDYYIGLRKRMEKARQAQADLFISIHADAFKNQQAKGSSVYVLSNRGASSEAARWLANSENAADLVGGVSLDDKEGMLASVLLDMSQNATEEDSAKIASEVLKNLKSLGNVHKKQVQRAGFMVLKSPDVPSILIETAFISNKREEAKLRSPSHQSKVASSILKGVKAYFSQQYLPGATTRQTAQSNYKIKRGDTLSAIAQTHRVSLLALKKINSMTNNRIRVGQVIRIPS